jgi:hypothetical protein
VYESQQDMLDDVRMCEEITGFAPVYTSDSVQMVMSGDTQQCNDDKDVATASTQRVRKEYTSGFESFWAGCYPKKRKEDTYEAYQRALDCFPDFPSAWAAWRDRQVAMPELVLEQLALFMDESIRVQDDVVPVTE